MGNSRVPQKDDTNPNRQPMLHPAVGNGKAGQAWPQRPLRFGAWGMAAGRCFTHLGPKLCVPCLSVFDLNFVLASPEQVLFQMPKSVFSPVFRSILKKINNQGYQARRLTYQTTTPQARGLKNSSHVILKLVFAAAELYPHPLQSPASEVLHVRSFLPEGQGAQLFVQYCTVMPISAIKVLAKLTWNVLQLHKIKDREWGGWV